ncbi:MAG TPA: hypothetical protein VF401_03420 [Candidatus Saccharimonadales bacterium]
MSKEFVAAGTELAPYNTTLEECRLHFAFGKKIMMEAMRYGSISQAVSYWEERVLFEEAKEAASPDEAATTTFSHRGKEVNDIPLTDARKRLRLHEAYKYRAGLVPGLRPEDYGLTKDRLAADQQLVDRHKKNYQKEYRSLGYTSKIRDAERYLQAHPHASRLLDAGVLEPVSLLEAPIRKADITPKIVAVIGGFAYRSYLAAFEESENEQGVYMRFPEASVASAVGQLTHRYYGNVPAVIGTKLPVTAEFMEGYFLRQDLDAILPETVTRLQFDATLKPTGKPAFVARVGTVIYESVSDAGDHRITTTVRKVDRMAAELAIQSLRNEAQAISGLIDSHSYEVLAGLPSLGKRR